MYPESVFHIAARLIFLHMNHIMLLLCSKLSRALISVRRKVKVFNTTYKVPCDLPHPIHLWPLSATPVISASFIPLQTQWATLLQTCQCMLISKPLHLLFHVPGSPVPGWTWSLSSVRHCSNVAASKALSWPLRDLERHLLCPLSSHIFLLRFTTTCHVLI